MESRWPPTAATHFPISGGPPRPTTLPSRPRKRPPSPPSEYINPLFLSTNSTISTSSSFLTGHRKRKDWYAIMMDRLRRLWGGNGTSAPSPSASGGALVVEPRKPRSRTQSDAPLNERRLRAHDREFNATFGYADNYIKTSKYNILTFLPKNLFEQFQRLANFYFLILMILQFIPWISSISWYSTAIPLAIVLGVSALKDGYDDIQRHRSDSQVNNRISYVVRNGRLEEERWMNVKVGDVIRMENEHFIAADLLLLSTSEPHGICYIETAELDGETNLKTRAALPDTAEMGDIVREISTFDGEIICEPPNNRLDRFEGRLIYRGRTHPLDNNKMLLRGCRLRNTRWCYGLVIFAGKETKLMMNSGKTKFKRTSLDRFLNILIMGIVLFLIAMCLICTVLCGVWEFVTGQNFTVYLQWEPIVLKASDNNNTRIMFISFLMFFSYIILLNTVVPISLYVSVEIIRFAHSIWINSDLKMYDTDNEVPAQARTTTLNEELGQVQYVFSDKTGTLTQNIMTFNKCSINGRSYGDLMSPRGETIDITPETPSLDFSWNRWSESTFRFYDPTLLDDTRTPLHEVEEFWRLLAICHTVMPERKAGSILEYQAQSPDEAALTSAARNFGFVFKSRTPSSITIEVMGTEETFEVLHILDFDNVRKRMSVIIRSKEGKIKLYCKGADTMIIARLREDTSDLLRQATIQHLDKFAADGLRTLCCGYKDIDPEYCAQWLEREHDAALDIPNKDQRLSDLYEEMEAGMTLLGATAIEDKLQDGVPETIANLAKANIKIWVLTGDKTETAINIGYSCHLLTEDMKEVFIVDGKDEREVEIQLKDIKRRMDKVTFTPALNVGRSEFYAVQWPTLEQRTKTVRDYIRKQIESAKAAEGKEIDEESRMDRQLFRRESTVVTSNNVGASSFYDYPSRNGRSASVAPVREPTNVRFECDSVPIHPDTRHSPPSAIYDEGATNTSGYGLVINGDSLVYALKRKYEKLFLEVGALCSAVICCRVTPLQKAQVVDLVKRHKKAVTLSIGDGANDVSMIKTAHIGVGISGKEGMQAVLSSDYSIGQFRFLERLLLVHGRWSYFRMCKFLRYFFYKNFSFTLTHFWYSFFCGYSAQTVYDATLIACYNMFFTALPVLAMGVFDQDVSDEYSLRYPKLYIPGQYNLFFNMRIFTYSVIHGMVSSLVLFFVPYGAFYHGIDHSGKDMNDYPMLAFTVFTCLIVVVTGQIMLDTAFWTAFNHFVIWGSLAFYFGLVLIFYQVLPYAFVSQTSSGISRGVALRALSSPHFWFSLILICGILLLPVLMNRFFWFDTHPSYADRLRVRSKLPEYALRDEREKQKPIQRTAATRRSRRGSLRSGYAFSHSQGFGELIAKGTLFKNIDHLRAPSNRSPTKEKRGLSPLTENSNSTARVDTFRPLTAPPATASTSTSAPIPQTASSRTTSSDSSSRRYSPKEFSPTAKTRHAFVVNQDSNPLPSGWRRNPDGILSMPIDYPTPPTNRQQSIASASTVTDIQPNGHHPYGTYPARRATIEVDSDSDMELTARRRRVEPNSTAFPVQPRRRRDDDRPGDTLV